MIKKLSKCIRQYKKDSILTPIYVSLESIIEIIIPLFMAKLIDNGIDTNNINYIYKCGFILIILCVLSLFCGAMSGRHAAIASSGFAKNVRHDMFYNVQNFSFSNIDKFSTAGIVTRLTTDVTNVQNSYQMIIRIAVRSPVLFISALVMSFVLNKNLSLIFLCAIPILGIGLFKIIRIAYPIFKRVFKTYDKLSNVVQENLHGIRVVKSFVREKHEVEKFSNISKIIFDDFTKAEKTLALNMPLMQFCMYMCMILISWFGARIIVSSGASELTTGELMSMFTYTSQILMGLMMLSMVLVMITISRASAERICEILDEKSSLTNCNNPKYDVLNGDITFENVNFSYSENKSNFCLRNINFSVKSGETVGIIGGTGSSKSTLVQLIPRLYDASEGKVTVGGVDVKNIDIEVLRNNVAMVLQKNVLFSGTIRENLLWGNEYANDNEIAHACKLAQADNFINDLPCKYDSYIEQGGTNVSGGQKQRLCIARALLKKPKILILDDSTSAVDTKTDLMIRKAFKEEIPNITKIIIAQRISSIQDADKIIVMDGGKINAVGTHEELMEKSSIYKEVYNSQMKAGEKYETQQ